MRYLTLFLVATSLLSCSSTEPRDRSVRVNATDLTRYTEKGFLITPDNYPGEYQSVGYVSVEVEPKAEVMKDDTEPYDGMVEGPLVTSQDRVYYDPPELRAALDSLYEKSTSMGADAVINFQQEGYEIVYSGASLPALRVSGFAIQRNNNE